MLGSLRCFRAPATVRCFRAPVTERYFRVPGCHLRYFRAPATSVQHCESQHIVREHTVRAASIVFHMFMHLFLIVHEIRKSFVHSIWPKSYTDYRVLFNPSSHACESLAMQEAFQLPHQYGLGKAGSSFMMNRIDAVVLKASKGEQGSEERLVGKCKSM